MSNISFKEYLAKIVMTAGGISEEPIQEVIETLKISKGSSIFAIGNGGSAAIASHFVTDLFRSYELSGSSNKVFSLADNTPLITASGNDYGFETIFARQISKLGCSGDVLVAISSSGNSQNIIDAVHVARKLGLATIGLSGFDGGKLLKLVDIAIHAETDVGEYQIVEDIHASICHYICKTIGASD